MHVEACECGQACFHYCLSAGYSRDSIWITLETPQLWLAHDRPGKAPKLYRGLYSDPVVGLVYSLPWVRNGSLRLWQMIFTSYSGQRGTVMSLELIIFWSPLSFSAYIFKHAHWHGDKRRHIHTINRPQMWARTEPLLCSARENRQSHAKASLETRTTRSASKTIWHCINLPCNYKRFHLHLSKTLFSHVFPHCIGAIGFLQG